VAVRPIAAGWVTQPAATLAVTDRSVLMLPTLAVTFYTPTSAPSVQPGTRAIPAALVVADTPPRLPLLAATLKSTWAPATGLLSRFRAVSF